MLKKALIIASAIISCVLIFVSCPNNNQFDGTVGGPDIELKNSLTLSISNYDEIIKRYVPVTISNNARTINTAYDEDNLAFFLEGIATNNQTYTPTEPLSITDKSFSVSIAPYNWILTLYAVPAIIVDADYVPNKDDAVLIGTARADLSKTSAAVTFYLSDAKTGEGSMDIALELNGWSLDEADGMTAYVQLTDKITGAVVKTISYVDNRESDTIKASGSANKKDVKEENIFSTGDKNTHRFNYFAYDQTKRYDAADSIYNIYAIPTGSYNFEVVFEQEGFAPYIYSDVIYIHANNETKIDALNPILIDKFIEESPTAPTNLIAKYVGDEDPIKGTYTTRFEWKDKSSNESYFKLQIKELTGDPTTDADWTKNILNDGFTDKIIETDYYVSGANSSLQKNSTGINVRLDLGKKYTARLCATNRGGDSDWTETTVDNTTFTTGIINRYIVRYNLQGGTGTGDLYEYHFADETNGVSLSFPTSVAYNTLQLTAWTNKPGIATAETIVSTSDKYKGYNNITYYAYYGTGGSYTQYNINDYNLLDSWITVANNNETPASVTLAANTVITIEKPTDGILTWTIAPVAGGSPMITKGFKYKAIGVTIKTGNSTWSTGTETNVTEVEEDGSGATEITTDVSLMETGVAYQVTISAIVPGYSDEVRLSKTLFLADPVAP